jgi:hypothetical protein
VKRPALLFSILVILLSACGSTTGEDIEVHNPWARPTAQGENAAVYFQIHNHSQTADELVGASSNISDDVEIHESKMVNDVMQMNMVSSMPLGADEEVNFEPGGYHIMMVNISQELKVGDHIGVILHFKNHEDIVVDVHIENSMPNEDHEHE